VKHQFFESYRLDITPLSPLHLGTGDSYDPTSYVIEDGTLFAFSIEDAMAACSLEDRKALLQLVSRRDALQVLLGVQRFFFERRERLIARSSHFVPVRRANEEFYKRRIGSETNPGVGNLLDIERTAYDPATGRPIFPGSGIKGAIRTALLDGVNQGGPLQPDERDPKKGNAMLQQRLFGYRAGRFEIDPMRLVQIGDGSAAADANPMTEIRFALNRKKKKVLRDGHEVTSQAQSKNLAQVLEVVRPLVPRAFQCQLNLQLVNGLSESMSGSLPRKEFRWSMLDIARSCHAFYSNRFEQEAEVLEDHGFGDAKWMQLVRAMLNSQKEAITEGRAFLLRVGRHSGAESVTLNGVRRIRIMQGRGRPDTHEAEAKTLWLAGDDPRASDGLLPFGWVLVEITPQGSEPRPWTESFEAYHQPFREWRARLDTRLREIRLRTETWREPGADSHGGPTTQKPASESPDILAPFHQRLRTFKSSEYGQLPALLEGIQARADAERCLQLLGARLLALYRTDKKRLETLREKFPALAPYLLRS
jgi:CRISPR-associated protein Csm5